MKKLLQPRNVNNMERTYQNAIALLETRRRARSQRWIDEQSQSVKKQAPSGELGVKGKPAIDRMGDWVEQLGYSDINLDVVHVAGTKGKGSTCAFVSSFLQQCGRSSGFPSKIGLYTSPPLITMRERIQINAEPISEHVFTKYTFEVWDKLWYHASQTAGGLENMPRYRQFFMLLSLHVFASEKVDIAVYETHSGGEYDCTNIVKPSVTGITSIGMDHVRTLGPKIENIAWHKAGIFKAGVPAFSMKQRPEVEAVLQNRASEKGLALNFTNVDGRLPLNMRMLKFDVQKMNASLAIALAETVLKKNLFEPGYELSETNIRNGLDHFSWPGRFHHIQEGQYQWYLDTAHNELSLEVATEWFAQAATTPKKSSNNTTTADPTRVLIFSHESDRDKAALLRTIFDTLRRNNLQVQNIIFTTYEERSDGTTSIDFHNAAQPKISLEDLQEYENIWRKLDLAAQISLEPTIEEALQRAVTLANPDYGLQAFVTGHDRLIGPALSILEPVNHKSYSGEDIED